MPPIVNIEEDRVLKCIRATKTQLERWRSSQCARELVDELVETLLVDFIGVLGLVANETKLLQGDVKKMIGMRASDGEGRERPPDLVKRWLQRCSRNPHDAHRVDALAHAPLSGVVAAVGNDVEPAKCLPYAAIRGILSPGRLEITPTLAEQVIVSRRVAPKVIVTSGA